VRKAPLHGLTRPEDKQLRVLHCVRHGHYEERSDVFGGTLTERGREQARHAGRHLARWPIAKIHASDLGRALDTAGILADELGGPPIRKTGILREVLPTRLPGHRVPLAVRASGQDNLGKIVARFFRPIRATRHEAIVTHGNLIRALTCRALGVRPTVWLKMRIHHLSVTRFAVRPDGSVVLLGYNDIGYFRSSCSARAEQQGTKEPFPHERIPTFGSGRCSRRPDRTRTSRGVLDAEVVQVVPWPRTGDEQ
jgi:serine/threonine-protein phosphatase PGAM5